MTLLKKSLTCCQRDEKQDSCIKHEDAEPPPPNMLQKLPDAPYLSLSSEDTFTAYIQHEEGNDKEK